MFGFLSASLVYVVACFGLFMKWAFVQKKKKNQMTKVHKVSIRMGQLRWIYIDKFYWHWFNSSYNHRSEYKNKKNSGVEEYENLTLKYWQNKIKYITNDSTSNYTESSTYKTPTLAMLYVIRWMKVSA